MLLYIDYTLTFSVFIHYVFCIYRFDGLVLHVFICDMRLMKGNLLTLCDCRMELIAMTTNSNISRTLNMSG